MGYFSFNDEIIFASAKYEDNSMVQKSIGIKLIIEINLENSF